MGRDLTLYPRSANRADLKAYLEGMGFKKIGHWWDWPKGTLNYSWFEWKDYKSIDGVSADVFPLSGKDLEITGNEWALHVRNLYSASWHDVFMLNEVLRGAKKRFGGTIRGDYGTNRYAPLWLDKSTPISRGISAVSQRVNQDLRAVKLALPNSSMQGPKIESQDAKARQFFEFTQSFDPARVIYNGLVPFAVSMFEYFFSRAFRVLIAYDPYALKRRSTHALRVDFSSVLDVSSGVQAIEDVIAQTYTFQNLNQLNKAFKEWLEIDVRALLFKRKRIGKKVSFLENRIEEIIEYRHGVIHRFELDRSLTKEGYIAILDAIEASIEEFLRFIEKKYAIKIDRD